MGRRSRTASFARPERSRLWGVFQRNDGGGDFSGHVAAEDARQGATAGTVFWSVLLGLVFTWTVMGTIAIVQLGLCHGIAKMFLGATGTFTGVMRPLLLGWFVNGLIVIPAVGNLAAAIAWTAVLMMVFEEVDGIERMQAFLISAGINVAFLALTLAFGK